MAGELAPTLPEAWEVRRLDAVATIIDSLHKTPSYSDVGSPMIRVTDVQGGFLEISKTLRVSEEVFQEFTRRYAPQKGDMVFSRVGSYGNVSYARTDTPFCLGQNTALISPRINGRFLHLFLQSAEARWQIEQVVVGSTQKTISLKSISALQIPIPPPDELEAIAHVLGTLDDKIELNRRMNATLEAMARALFQSWFVDFDPVRAKLDGRQPEGMDEATAALFPDSFQDSEAGHIPAGWKVLPVGDVVTTVGGATPSTKEPIYWEGGTHHWTTPKDFSSLQSPILLETNRKITDAGLAKISSGLLPSGTVLLSSRAPVGYLAIATMPVAINQGFIAMKCNDRASNYFILNWCQANMPEIHSRATGTTFAEISKKDFRPILVTLPPAEVMDAFTSKIAPIYAQITSNLKESCSLAAVRDTLLPKLLSGDVSLEPNAP